MKSSELELVQAELKQRREAQEHFLPFVQYTKDDFQVNWHHKEVCLALERVERREISRLIIEAPPRHTKSELASRRFPAWYLGRHPNEQIICATYNADMSMDFGRDVRNIVAGEHYTNVFPGIGLRADSKAANRWHTTAGGIYVSAGVGTALTGRGAHIAIIDDPFKDRQEADSEARRETVWDWYRAVFLTRLMPDAAIIVVATRWAEDDLTGRILETAEKTGEHWHRITLPAIDSDGKALWPEWYGLEALERLRATMGPRDWLSLYQQQPTTFEGTFFERSWVRYYDAKKTPKDLSVYISADYAVTQDKGDFTEIGVWGVDSLERVYVLDWWSGKTGAETWIDELLHRVERFKPLALIGETGPIRRAVEPFLRKRMRETRCYCLVEWLPHTSNKQANARSFQALMSNGRIYWPELEWAEQCISQLLKFPSGKYDDKVDACSLFARHIHKTWGAINYQVTKEPEKREPQKVIDFVNDCFGDRSTRAMNRW